MAHTTIKGEQLDIQDIAEDMSNDPTAIQFIADGVSASTTAYLPIDGSLPMTGPLDLASFTLTTTGLINGRDVALDGLTLDAHIGGTNPHGITKGTVGLGNADDTNDLAKPVSVLTQTALDLKVNINDAALTGTPTAPSPTLGLSTTQIATTEFVSGTISTIAINALVDVAIGTAAQNQALIFDATGSPSGQWTNQQIDHVTLANIGTNNHAVIDTHIVDTSIHFSVLDGLVDVDVSTVTPTDGQRLAWNAGNSMWEPSTPGAIWSGITGILSSQTDLQDELDLKANLAAGAGQTFTGNHVFGDNPSFVGTPITTTAPLADSTSRIANTAFVAQEIAAIPPSGGATILDDLTDVVITGSPAAVSGDVLTFDGANWINQVPSVGGITNLTYDAATSTVTNDNGTSAVLTVADGTNPGLLTSIDFTQLSTLTTDLAAKEPFLNNPTTDGDILSSTIAGVRTWITPSVGGTTNLGYTAATGDGLITNDNGTDATILAADATNAGLLLPADFTQLSTLTANLAAKTTDATVAGNHYTKTEVNADAPATGAKIDKFVGVIDNIVTSSDTIGGLKDSTIAISSLAPVFKSVRSAASSGLIVASDAGNYVNAATTSPVLLSLPLGGTVGTEVTIVQTDITGAVTFSANIGVTLNGVAGATDNTSDASDVVMTVKLNGVATLICIAANDWVVYGDIA